MPYDHFNIWISDFYARRAGMEHKKCRGKYIVSDIGPIMLRDCFSLSSLFLQQNLLCLCEYARWGEE